MTGRQRSSATKPWYREPYVWLLITFPALAVVSGIATLAIALVSDDGLVVDDYYKRGKQINRVLQRDQVASRLGLEAVLRFTPSGSVTVQVTAHEPRVAEPTVQLSLSYATRSGYDQVIELHRSGADATYSGRFEPLRQGKWLVQLQTSEWRLVRTLRAPPDSQYSLKAEP